MVMAVSYRGYSYTLPVTMVLKVYTDSYHGAGVLLQLSGGDGALVVEEQILKEALRHQSSR